MPWFANDRDGVISKTIGRWKRIAAETVECEIGSWRDAKPRSLAGYWKHGCTFPPSGPPELPNGFCSDTTYLVGVITASYPRLDPAPLQEIYSALAAWYADRNATRIPPQPVLYAMLERAMMTLQAIEHDIESRMLSADPAMPADTSTGEVPEGETTTVNADPYRSSKWYDERKIDRDKLRIYASRGEIRKEKRPPSRCNYYHLDDVKKRYPELSETERDLA